MNLRLVRKIVKGPSDSAPVTFTSPHLCPIFTLWLQSLSTGNPRNTFDAAPSKHQKSPARASTLPPATPRAHTTNCASKRPKWDKRRDEEQCWMTGVQWFLQGNTSGLNVPFVPRGQSRPSVGTLLSSVVFLQRTPSP